MEKKYLSQEDMKKIEVFSEKAKTNKMHVKCLNAEKDVLVYKIKALQLELQLKEKELLEVIEFNKTLLKNHKDYVDSLKKSLDVTTEQFGYDPISGEIL